MMKYLGKTHNLWHRMTLNLEQMAIDQTSSRGQRDQMEIYDYETESTTPTVCMAYDIAIVKTILYLYHKYKR